jgi:hypothetical protein
MSGEQTEPEALRDILARHPYLQPTKPGQYLLLLEDAGGHYLPLIQRAKSLLKLMLRGYRMKCVAAITIDGGVAL